MGGRDAIIGKPAGPSNPKFALPPPLASAPTHKAILRRKPKGFKGASNDSRFVQGLTDQYVTGCALRKLDVHEGQEILASMAGAAP